VSAHHGRKVHDLLDMVASRLPLAPVSEPQSDILKVAIVGRPNAGKSMLLNSLLGEERAIVSEVPGTTRDSLDTIYHLGQNPVLLIDTAGMRKRGQIQPGIEQYSVLRSVRAIARSDVSLLVIDGSEGVTAQDLHIAGYIRDSYKGMILLVNKWDLVPEELREAVAQQIEERFRFVAYAPVLDISAKFSQGIDLILPQADRVWQERKLKVPDVALTEFLQETLTRHGPSRSGTKELKISSLTQAGTDPPTFVFSVNDPEIVHFSYRRYLENSLRQEYGYYGSPILITFRKKSRTRSSASKMGKVV
jgi:GTPase